jgi:site-specific DNA-methyltransferase (cytosine-N4-specific)
MTEASAAMADHGKGHGSGKRRSRGGGPAAHSTDPSGRKAGAMLGVAGAVQSAYVGAGDRPLSNKQVYQAVAKQLELDLRAFETPSPGGQNAFSVPARTVRWVQQTLKVRGLLERTEGERGVWRLTPKGKFRLRHVESGQVLVAFHTRLGVALLADCRAGFAALGEPISLVLTSPPYPIAHDSRGYRSPRLNDYVGFLTGALEPIVGMLVAGGSIALNLSNDIFEPGTPARSLYLEYLTIALHERLGLSLTDRLVWHNPTKPPGPVAWASLKRYQLNVGYEPVLLFTNDPLRWIADNRRVLEPHSPRHLKLIGRGGEPSAGEFADGAYRRPPGAFAGATAGRIPKNVITLAHGCKSQRQYKAACRAAGLRPHGAPYPLALASFLISYLSEEGSLVADPFAGSQTTALAAERLNRRWVTTELVADYVRGGAYRFSPDDGLWVNPDLDLALELTAGRRSSAA